MSTNGTDPTADPANATDPAGDDSDEPSCGDVVNETPLLGLRIGSIFIIMLTSLIGSLFPIITKRTKLFNVPRPVFDFAKYFGSGVIIATAFIHLLDPALEELGSDCLTGTWTQYPWALALSMFSVFAIFFLELIAFRWGSAKLAAIGIKAYDPHGHEAGSAGAHAAHGPEQGGEEKRSSSDVEQGVPQGLNGGVLDTAVAQIVGIAILEFGIVLHSVLIGLTLAVDQQFKILFIVIVFHQMFEGLGLGTRLAFIALPEKYNWVPVAGALLYGLTTAVGIAAGLGVRTTYNPESQKAVIVSGVLDALSSGILLYTGLVELLAHEFLFNPTMAEASNGRLIFASISMLAGAGIMSLLGNWA